jgi:biopolymer transport protein TolQ
MDETTTAIAEGALTKAASGFSAWDLFWQADIVVKMVMLALIVASIWSWSVIISKWMRYRAVKAQADRFEDNFWSGASLDKLYDGTDGKADNPFAMVFAAAMTEWRRSFQPGAKIDKASIKQRLHTVMRVTFEREMDRLERSLNFLATVGSVSPFVGLFGTVWGIMRSFFGIASAQNTSLAVVAPGIAEALFATAIGLFAAIPAVIGYNKLQADAARFGNRLSTFCDEFSAILSRQLDEKGH